MIQTDFFSSPLDLEIERFGYITIPKYTFTEDDIKNYSLTSEDTSDSFLLKLTREGFKKKRKEGKIPKDKEAIYGERAKQELQVYQSLFFADYILLIYNIIQFCHKNNILNSPSRGSCGGSLVLYLIEVTQIDPIKHNLLFERFISQSRTEVKEFDNIKYLAAEALPDVDIDSDQKYKPLINEFLAKLFPEKTCRICNLTTLQSKAAIKESGKIVGAKTEQEMVSIAEMIPAVFGKVEKLEKVYEENPEFKKWANENIKIYSIARKLHGLIKNKSVHASGIFISNFPLLETLPTELDKDKNIITSYDMDWCQKLGLKVDNLGLKNLEAIHSCLKQINKNLEDIDVNDPSIYTYLSNSDDYYGVFQAEEGLGKKTLKAIKPQTIEDIFISIALARPGSFNYIEDYCKFRHENDDKHLKDLPENLRALLKGTGGIIIFQETLMMLSRVMASFSPQEADKIRKIIGKKRTEEMPKWESKFKTQSLKNGYNQELIDKIWETFWASANYSFNQCLSPDTIVETLKGPKLLFQLKKGNKILGLDIKNQKEIYVKVVDIYKSEEMLYEVEFEDGRTIKCSLKHKFLCEDLKMYTLEEIISHKYKIACKT